MAEQLAMVCLVYTHPFFLPAACLLSNYVDYCCKQWRTLNKIFGGAKLQTEMEILFETPNYMTQTS
jgi:hypothetical protein